MRKVGEFQAREGFADESWSDTIEVFRDGHATSRIRVEGFCTGEAWLAFDVFDLLDAAGIHVGFYSLTGAIPTEVVRGGRKSLHTKEHPR